MQRNKLHKNMSKYQHRERVKRATLTYFCYTPAVVSTFTRATEPHEQQKIQDKLYQNI